MAYHGSLDVLDSPEEDQAPSPSPGRQRLALVIAISALALLAVITVGSGWFYLRSVDQGVTRTPVLGSEVSRPPKVVPRAVNVLLMGIDDADEGSSRSDTIMLMHLSADRKSAQIVSIPRDTWIRVPRSVEPDAVTEEAKINSAYAWGGAPLVVRTVEGFTGVRIDHTVVIDLAGFARVIDAIGGVDVMVDTPFTSVVPPYQHYPAGLQHMDSGPAIYYAQERKSFASGDFARMEHQRAIITAVFDKLLSLDVLSNPIKMDAVIRSTAAAFIVDESLSLLDLATMLRDLRGSDLSTLTSPSTGTGMVGTQSVVFPDSKADAELFAAIRDDTMATWLAAHPT
jgi:LCP family protein required for cell wall assembly